MGRHSVPDDYDDDAAAVLSAPPTPASRPRPGRHSGNELAAPAPQGLDVIETVMGRDEIEADDVDDVDQADEADEADAPDKAETDEHTAQIEPIVDPVLDEPLPVAVTTVIPPVADGPAPAPRPAPRPSVDTELTGEVPAVADEAATDLFDDGAGQQADAKADAAAEKAAAKAEKSADRSAEKAEKAAEKAEKAAEKAAAKERKAAAKDERGTAPGRPEPRVSDFALLRTDSAARARVIAAIVVPFLLYFGVLFVLDALDLRTALIWIWVPLISAGVVAGLLLDLAHRAAAVRAITALEQREPEPDAVER